MNSLKAFFLREAYKETQKLGDKLADIEPLIDWNAFTPIIQPLYDNQGPQGGRPNVDPVVMVKLLVLQQWYGLSDPELERQATDRISFRRFLGFPGAIPDHHCLAVQGATRRIRPRQSRVGGAAAPA